MCELDETFPSTYEVEEVGDFPGNGEFREPIYYFPRLKNAREHTGSWLKIKSSSENSWIGVFALEYQVPPAISRVLTTPVASRLCVISAGMGHIVTASNPDVYEQIPIFPILDVRAVKDKGLLIFSDFIRLAAYSRDSLIWKSPRVCWDDLKITNISDDIIEGVGYDPTSSEQTRFAVDLLTGRLLSSAAKSAAGESIW
ncbi:MAG TPA: hypothetical protein VLK33_12400 [Terriglobales bacterium]|nr:hypothetical protein [Terriglobales bacterium]